MSVLQKQAIWHCVFHEAVSEGGAMVVTHRVCVRVHICVYTGEGSRKVLEAVEFTA